MKIFLKNVVIITAVIMFLCVVSLLTACNTKTSASLGSGKKMTLVFEANPTTGYNWTYAVANDINNGELKLLKEEYEPNDKSGTLIGGGGHTTYVFEAVKAGKQNLRFVYRRPWEGGETAYDVIYELDIDDKLNITCLSKMKGNVESDKELSSFPNPVFE